MRNSMMAGLIASSMLALPVFAQQGPTGAQVTSTAFSFGFSIRTPGITYDLGYERAQYHVDRWYLDVPYDAVMNKSSFLTPVDRTITKMRLSGTYTF